MIKHYIILSSSYSRGNRIAMHYILTCDADLKDIKKDIERIRKECGDTVSISSHLVLTKSETWESVVRYDGFFESVKLISCIDEFIRLIRTDRELKKIDIEKYISALYEDTDTKCTQHQIDMLVIITFLYYYKDKQKDLCEDMSKYFDACSENEDTNIFEDDHPIDAEYSYMSAQSRILFAEDGVEKLKYINRTFERYKEYTVENLVKNRFVKEELKLFLANTHKKTHSHQRSDCKLYHV